MYGIKVSKPGFDVKTAERKDLIMISDAEQYRVHLSGEVNFTSDSQRIDIAHGLAYTPSFLDIQDDGTWGGVNNYIDGTNLSLLGDNGDSTRYIIFLDLGA